MGIVTTADVFDATPAAHAVHSQDRGAGTGIVDQFFDDANKTGLTVLLGGGRKWFLPNTTAGPARVASSGYVLPSDIVSGWGVAPGAYSSDPVSPVPLPATFILLLSGLGMLGGMKRFRRAA